jgi:hypothetical protein
LTLLRRSLLAAIVVTATVLALGVTPAFAAKDCGRQIIDDWFKDGRVDKIYPLHCYEDALNKLPNDVRTYSDAPQAIRRALSIALAKGAPVDPPKTTSTSTDTSPTDTNPTDTSPTDTSPTSTGPTDTTPSDGSGGPGDEEALGDQDSSASSVPIPLLVLGGLALLLLAAGGAGYLNRRLQARRIDGGPGDPPVAP